MAATQKPSGSRIFDLPLIIAAGLVTAFYLIIGQESFKDSIVQRYTTEHAVEYVIITFFIWGITDVVFRALGFPREILALRQDYLPKHTGREPVAGAAALRAALQKRPKWMRDSRLGLRFASALDYLDECGSTNEFSDYLRFLAEQDDQRTYANYGLVRFITWVTPMLGFLGTVIHFGTALGGHTAGDLGEKLPTVVAEMGTAFNTTTVALMAATSMMFCLFLSERAEREIIRAVDRRVDGELLHRFESADASLTPFLDALAAANHASQQAMDASVERQRDVWSKQQQWQSQLWVEALEKLQDRFEANDVEREQRLARVLENAEKYHQEQAGQIKQTVDQVSAVKADFAKLVESLSSIASGEHELVSVQTALSDNLRLLRETNQLDQAFHGLTAAIHMLTARNQSSLHKEHRAA